MLPSTPPVDACIAWEKPRFQTLKLNIDTAFHPDKVRATSAAVLRDSKGTVVFSTTCFHVHADSALHGEYLALMFGLEMVVVHDYSCDVVESDSLTVINDIKKGFNSFSRLVV